MDRFSPELSEISLLYVEDEADAREMVSRMLATKYPQLRLLVAEHGASGLELFRENRPDLVITDIRMPVMDGIHMAAEIRKENPETIVIAMTAFNDADYLLEALEIGITHYIMKPVKYERLFAVVDEGLGLISLKRQVRRQDAYIRKLSRAVEGNPCSIMITDPQGVIEYVNPKFTELTGYRPEEVLGRTPAILNSGATPREIYKELWGTIRAGKGWRGEVLNRKKDGGLFWESSYISPIIDAEGNITNFVAVNQDITELKYAAEALRKSEQKFAKVFQAAPALMALTTLDDGRCLDANDAFLKECGLARGDAVGKPALERCLWKDGEEREAVVRELLERGEVHDREVLMTRGGGRPMVGLLSAELVEIEEECCLLIVVQDITERKRMDERMRTLNAELEQKVRERTVHLEASIRELEGFSYAVSHDLRAPLNRLEGFCTALREDYAERLDPAGTMYVESIARMSQDVKSIVDALLRLSTVTKKELRLQRVDLSEMARSVAQELSKELAGRTVHFVIADGVSATGDPALLQQALVNLLGNACKFTRDVSPAVIEFGSSAHGEGAVYFVRDNGAGFDMKYATQLFRPFHRLHGEGEFPGEGIGLATVQRIIQSHGGRIWASAQPGRGATFFFTLGSAGARGTQPAPPLPEREDA